MRAKVPRRCARVKRGGTRHHASPVNARIRLLLAGVLFSLGGALIKACTFPSLQRAGLRSLIAAVTLFLLLPEARRHEIFVATAAVADWRPAQAAGQKLKKDGSGQVPALTFVENPDILATVAKLPAAERPFCVGFAAESDAVLANARAMDASAITKSGIMLGLGEEWDEVISCLRDLRRSDVNIVTLGQYLRPSDGHLPVARYYTPDEFA
jgi:hypothetical protein